MNKMFISNTPKVIITSNNDYVLKEIWEHCNNGLSPYIFNKGVPPDDINTLHIFFNNIDGARHCYPLLIPTFPNLKGEAVIMINRNFDL